MDGFINFFIFDFTHPFREEIGTCIRYIHKASAKCTRNYVLRHAIARAFFFKLDAVRELFVQVLKFCYFGGPLIFRRRCKFFAKRPLSQKNFASLTKRKRNGSNLNKTTVTYALQ